MGDICHPSPQMLDFKVGMWSEKRYDHSSAPPLSLTTSAVGTRSHRGPRRGGARVTPNTYSCPVQHACSFTCRIGSILSVGAVGAVSAASDKVMPQKAPLPRGQTRVPASWKEAPWHPGEVSPQLHIGIAAALTMAAPRAPPGFGFDGCGVKAPPAAPADCASN